jgi:hypothetical protein
MSLENKGGVFFETPIKENDCSVHGNFYLAVFQFYSFRSTTTGPYFSIPERR